MAKVTVANFYPVYPVGHGGQRRIYFLARELSRDHDVTVVSLSRAKAARYLEFGPSFREIQVPASKSYVEFEGALQKSTPMIADVAYAMRWEDCYLYQSILQERMKTSDLAISEHPYSFPALMKAMVPSRKIPLIYNSQNVETRQKAPVLAGRDDLMDVVRSVESTAIRESVSIVACSKIDRSHFIADYSAPEGKISIIENGVDVQSVPEIDPQQVMEFRRYLRLKGKFVTVFGGSYHFPNIAAVKAILDFARALPDVIFVILGSIGKCPALAGALPGNVLSLGEVSELNKWLCFSVSDLALNPMIHGSGSNIKMFEYAASALPTLSTSFGARATGLEAGRHCIEAELQDFPATIAHLSKADTNQLTDMGRAAKDFVVLRADWAVIGESYRKLVASIV